jgi:hypothetical protein
VKKIGFLLLVLTLSRVAVAYAATTTAPTTNQNFFFGNSATGSAAMNQVLALLVGPKGPPGPAGVAGKDGFVGLNGQNGQDGLPGAPGAIGPQGIPGATGPAGPQGAQGPAGPAGANGTNGTNGTGGGGSVSFGDGQILVGTCQPANETVTVSVDRYFTGTEFHFADFNFTGLNTNCGGKVITVDLVMANTISTGKTYLANDEVVCRATLATPPASTTTISDANSTCTIYRSHVNQNIALRLDSVNTLDFNGAIGFQIAG